MLSPSTPLAPSRLIVPQVSLRNSGVSKCASEVKRTLRSNSAFLAIWTSCVDTFTRLRMYGQCCPSPVSLCLDLVGLRENAVALGRRQQIEQLAGRDYIGVDVEALALQERQRPGNERVGDAGALQDDGALSPAARRPQAIDALGRSRGRRQAQGGPIQNDFRRTGDKRGDHCGPPRERRSHQEPDLLGLPRSEGDHRSNRKIVLQQLKGLRVGM